MLDNQIVTYADSDIEGIQRASQLAAATLDHIEDFIEEGISTEKLNTICQNYIEAAGGICAPLNYHGYPKATCISLNHVVCHGIPSEATILRQGDILNIDVTAILDGWFGDTSRMYCVGRPSIKAVRLIKAAYRAMWCGIMASGAGRMMGDVGYAIEKAARDEGFSVVRDFCGHGIGRQFHEPPSVLNYGERGKGVALCKGMCFTVEPMINIGQGAVKVLNDGWTVVTHDRTLSAQFEHTLVLGTTGRKVLTLSPQKRFVPGLHDIHEEVLESLNINEADYYFIH